MKWKRVFKKVRGGKRKLDCHEAHERGLTFQIKPEGGFITVKSYWLEIFNRRGNSILLCKFYKLKDAKSWAQDFMGKGAIISAHRMQALYA